MVFVAIYICFSKRQTKVAVDFVVGVKNEEQIGLSECAVKSQGSIVCEIGPLISEEFAVNALFFEKLGNNVLGAVG
jgi:hypothetical protein